MSKTDELDFLKYDLENMITDMMEYESKLSYEEKNHLSLHRRCLSILNRTELQESEMR